MDTNLYDLVRMSKKSNMNAHIVAIASRIKTRRNAIKIHCISDATHGLAQHLDMRRPSIPLRRGPTRLIRVDYVERISHALESLRHLPRVIKSQSLRNRTGRCA